MAKLDEVATDPLERAEAWRHSGMQLREQLIDERKRLTDRLERIEEALAQLPIAENRARTTKSIARPSPRASRTVETPQTPSAPTTILNATGPDLVKHVLADRPGASAADIITGVRRLRPSVPPSSIYSAINRVVGQKEVRVEGPTGQRRYWLAQESLIQNGITPTTH